MTELVGWVREVLADQSVPRGKTRYFGTPFFPQFGDLAGYEVVLYRGGRDPEVQEAVIRRHDAYVQCLTLAGLHLTETHLRLIDLADQLAPVRVQRRVPQEMLMSHLVSFGDTRTAINALDRAGAAISEFWRRVARRPERIGLQGAIESFALSEEGLICLETFPPLISYDRDEMGAVIQRFADSAMIRGLGKILPGRLREVQDRWYTPGGSAAQMVDGALRLRPALAPEILDWADGFSRTRLEASARGQFDAVMARHQRRLDRAGKGTTWRPGPPHSHA